MAAAFPSLAVLLSNARVTSVSVNGFLYELLAWDTVSRNRTGWLCLPSPSEIPKGIHPDHACLLHSFGGVVELFNEPDGSWLLNHNDVLTGRAAARDPSFMNDYNWAFEYAGIDMPIQLADYYVIASEANGNATFCHRTTGEVILFAPDHAFSHVKVYDGCPEYTLYKIEGVETLSDWVDAVAEQWLAHAAIVT